MAERIKIDNLTKDFGHGRGVFNASFSVEEGECFGYLGPNGAGKSTTIRTLMGFSKPDSGHCYIDGHDTAKQREEAMLNVSYIPGEVALPAELTGEEVIEVQKILKNVVDDTFLDYLKEYFELDASLKCKQMSLGMRRKLVVVSAFMNDPDVIVMDEPSSGLDPSMQDRFIALIAAEKRRGKTILLSSHIFREVDVSCDRIAIIKDGHIVSFFNSSDLKHKTLKLYEVKFSWPEDYQKVVKAQSEIYEVKEGNPITRNALFEVDDSKIGEFMELLSNYSIFDFRERKTTLEDYFMSFYKEEKSFEGING